MRTKKLGIAVAVATCARSRRYAPAARNRKKKTRPIPPPSNNTCQSHPTGNGIIIQRTLTRAK